MTCSWPCRVPLAGVLRRSCSSVLPERIVRARRREAGVSGRYHERLWIEIEIACDLLHQSSRDLMGLLHKGENQRVLADEVDDARDAAAGAVDHGDGIIGEDLFGGAGDEQP